MSEETIPYLLEALEKRNLELEKANHRIQFLESATKQSNSREKKYSDRILGLETLTQALSQEGLWGEPLVNIQVQVLTYQDIPVRFEVVYLLKSLGQFHNFSSVTLATVCGREVQGQTFLQRCRTSKWGTTYLKFVLKDKK